MATFSKHLLLMTLSSILAFFGCGGSGKPSLEVIDYAPFTIEKRTVRTSRFDYNTGQRRRGRHTTYRVLYQGEPIEFPAALEQNTGVPGLWKVYLLPDAPRPALIAGSQSVYLITEAEGAVEIRALSEQNSSFASLQWLDAQDGQPTPKQEIYRSDDSELDNHFAEGRFLLVNRTTVLRVDDLSFHSFRISTDLTQGYYAYQVVAFSPDHRQLVLMGVEDSRPRQKDYALLSYDYLTNETQIVPFERTACRLVLPYEAGADWVNTYFSWEEQPEGGYRLTKKALDPLPNWEGYLTQNHSYELQPVKAEIKEALLQFVKDRLQVDDAAVSTQAYGDNERYELLIGEHRYEIGHHEDLKTASFSPHFTSDHVEECQLLVKEIGEAFNAELRGGKYQDLFTVF